MLRPRIARSRREGFESADSSFRQGGPYPREDHDAVEGGNFFLGVLVSIGLLIFSMGISLLVYWLI